MRAIVRKQYGEADQLSIEQRPDPQAQPGQVLIEVRAFGLNRAEIYMRRGAWGEVADISGIECVGLVKADPAGRLATGQKVAALLGGMGRSIPGSYAEYVSVPADHVVPLQTELPWEALAAIPESYATAWTSLHHNLALAPGQTLLIRGATSALGRAAINIAAHAGAYVIATTRRLEHTAGLLQLGAKQVLLEESQLAQRVREWHPDGIDAVLDIIGNSALLDSLAMARPDGRVCQVGFLGGGEPLALFNPLQHMPSGVQLSFFGSAMAYGTPAYPLSDVPLQTIVERVADGTYQAKPAHVFRFEQIRDAHRLMESNQAGGKLVVCI
ncbi:zinc-binding dehydrogenase [Dyella tabacisoli]|uniref:Alcohol dehydrogenase n=1 Tax=Dyella tabacisoli TaxID=2282381 RepID=A0A369UH57_9GAMM|nr:zinc-binding dehydrogenase [Dyella tabacisoli]RDD79807.1 alcohol dehydrogenase [Dyella tabacisoli]